MRFKTAEFADEFLSAINNALNCTENQKVNPEVEKAAASFSFKVDNTSKSESIFTTGGWKAAEFPFGSTSSSLPSFGDFSFKDSGSPFFKSFSTSPDDQKSLDSKGFLFGKGKYFFSYCFDFELNNTYKYKVDR